MVNSVLAAAARCWKLFNSRQTGVKEALHTSGPFISESLVHSEDGRFATVHLRTGPIASVHLQRLDIRRERYPTLTVRFGHHFNPYLDNVVLSPAERAKLQVAGYELTNLKPGAKKHKQPIGNQGIYHGKTRVATMYAPVSRTGYSVHFSNYEHFAPLVTLLLKSRSVYRGVE